MSKAAQIAIIGEAEFCQLFRLFGLAVYSPANLDEARKMLGQVVEEKYSLCLIQTTWLEALKADLAAISHKFLPVCLGFSDYRGASESVAKAMRELSIRATGSDALFRERT
jgi:vacuolar-type H+-ATPase subunit F/Vma7